MSKGFVIAAAQSSSLKGDLVENVRRHCEFVIRAHEQHADFIVFPELSLSGYEPALAEACALHANSDVLDPLRQTADERGLVIVAGCPIRSNEPKPYLGAFIVRPKGKVDVYRKRFLHPGEEEHFLASDDTFVCDCNQQRIGIAICADIENPLHPDFARKAGASVYAAGVAMTPGGIARAESNMSIYARRHQMLAVMSNHASATGGFSMAGGSGVWDETGELVVQAADQGECLVIAQESNGCWLGSLVE